MSLPTKILWLAEPWKVINYENLHTFISFVLNMVYNDIAYEIKWFAQKNLLVRKSLAKPMHQDILAHYDEKQATVPHHRWMAPAIF